MGGEAMRSTEASRARSRSALRGRRAADPGRAGVRRAGPLVWITSLILLVTFLVQLLYGEEAIAIGFETWRPVLYAYVLWACRARCRRRC